MTSPAKPNPIPDSYRRITPCLTIQGAAKALEFYAAVFGAIERMRTPGPGGSIVHAEIEIGDSVVIIADENPYEGTKAPPTGGLSGFSAVPVHLRRGRRCGHRPRRGTRSDRAAPRAGPVLR